MEAQALICVELKFTALLPVCSTSVLFLSSGTREEEGPAGAWQNTKCKPIFQDSRYYVFADYSNMLGICPSMPKRSLLSNAPRFQNGWNWLKRGAGLHH